MIPAGHPSNGVSRHHFRSHFVFASASESRDSCGRTYRRLGLLVLLEVLLSEVGLICFPFYIWEWGVAERNPHDRWEEYLPVAISNIPR